jgi:hypothetical protein
MRLHRLALTLSAAAVLLAVNAPRSFAQASMNKLYSPVGAAIEAQPMEEAVQVQATLNRFDSALALHDIGQLQAEGVNAGSAKRWNHFFKDNPRAEVTDKCPASDLLIAGDTAVWKCTETATVISEGKPLPFEKVIRFTFTKTNGAWTISDRR